MANPVTIQDLEARWRPLTSSEQTVAEAALADSWAILLGRLPTLEQRIADEELSVQVVTFVVTSMVLRIMRNPDGKSEEQIDDYRYRRDAMVSSGRLFLADEELAMLSPTLGSGDAFTITPYGAPGYRQMPEWWT